MVNPDDRIDVLILSNGHPSITQYVIGTIVKNTFNLSKIKFKILQLGRDPRMDRFAVWLSKKGFLRSYLRKDEHQIGIYNGYMELLNHKPRLSSSYSVIWPLNMVLAEPTWHITLIQNYINYSSELGTQSTPGILAIKPAGLRPTIGSIWDSENNIKHVGTSDQGILTGILFFRTKSIMFDESFNINSFALQKMCIDLSLSGFQNFYVPNLSAVELPIENETLFPTKTDWDYMAFKTQVNDKLADIKQNQTTI